MLSSRISAQKKKKSGEKHLKRVWEGPHSIIREWETRGKYR